MSTPPSSPPRPEPSGASGVQLGALTHEVTVALRAALEQRSPTPSGAPPQAFINPRIIIGLILEPHLGGAAER